MRDGAHKPAVPRKFLPLIAGVIWVAVGAMLVALAAGWLLDDAWHHGNLLCGSGAAGAFIVCHFGFLRVVDKNLGRIALLDERPCAFAFQSWKSYLLVAVMIVMGEGLRQSPLPKPILAVLYIAIGGALLLSSLRYLRAFLGKCFRASF
jgi:hypothetical protein